jgi:hypothetical protein
VGRLFAHLTYRRANGLVGELCSGRCVGVFSIHKEITNQPVKKYPAKFRVAIESRNLKAFLSQVV